MPIDIKFSPDEDYNILVGSNGSGKTTLMKYFMSRVDKSIIYVLNAGGDKSWSKLYSPDRVVVPAEYTVKWLDKYLLRFTSDETIKRACLVFDDADNFDIRKSVVFKSMYINSRRLAVGGWLSVRKLNSIPIEVYNNARYLFIGRQNSDRTVWYLSETLGRARGELLKTLKPHNFLVYDTVAQVSDIIYIR
jgi:hypothetical protein